MDNIKTSETNNKDVVIALVLATALVASTVIISNPKLLERYEKKETK